MWFKYMKSKLVGFMGAPGTGKTTLACAMKEYLLTKNVSSDVCTEYAREFCFKYGISKDPYASYRMTLAQRDREDILSKGTNEYIFSDAPIWLGYVYPLINMPHGCSQEMYDILPDVYQRFVIDQKDRYHKVFYLKNENPYDDGCRDMEVNKMIADVMDGFVATHKHLLPIEIINDPIEMTEARKEVVWKKIQEINK